MQVDRREVIRLSGAAVALAALPAHASAAGLPVGGLVSDRRFPLARAAGAPAGVWRHEIDGDVTSLWVDRLDRDWRAPGPALAGITGEDALFVLERLAWDRGRRVVLREAVMGVDRPVSLIRWLIADRVRR